MNDFRINTGLFGNPRQMFDGFLCHQLIITEGPVQPQSEIFVLAKIVKGAQLPAIDSPAHVAGNKFADSADVFFGVSCPRDDRCANPECLRVHIGLHELGDMEQILQDFLVTEAGQCLMLF